MEKGFNLGSEEVDEDLLEQLPPALLLSYVEFDSDFDEYELNNHDSPTQHTARERRQLGLQKQWHEKNLERKQVESRLLSKYAQLEIDRTKTAFRKKLFV